MKFPESLAYRCGVKGCGEAFMIPASAQYADSAGDPRYAGFLVVLELDEVRDHFKKKHMEGGSGDVPDISHELEPVSDGPADPPGDH